MSLVKIDGDFKLYEKGFMKFSTRNWSNPHQKYRRFLTLLFGHVTQSVSQHNVGFPFE